jgi:1-deoxy-D-xylulose-5-phosphate synthase
MPLLLDNIRQPADLRRLGFADLEALAAEVRMLILDTVSRTGGHLAANLGAVELTIGLLRTFDPPRDKIVWDVSHQTYAYKILTGRKDRFRTLRQQGGLSGFASREESEYDAFGAGHSGTALSAALGMAVARDRRGGEEHVVAVIGDGSMGCGLSLEALNHVATTTGRIIVILNDNEMSIAANVGSMSRSLGRLLANPRYNRWKRSVESFASKLRMGWFRAAYYRVEEAVKSLFLRSVVFEEFGLRYIGPIDGHNLRALLDALTIARNSDRRILLHVSTQKGRGFALAEEHPEKWHGTPAFDVETGEPVSPPDRPSYSAVFGAALERLAEQDGRIVAITAAMTSGTGLSGFARKLRDRFFDVGICEEHAVVFAAGLAADGFRPVVAVYSTFFQRAVDCVIHDVCLQNLPVVFCLDRAGVVGDDGPTHQGVFDIALLRPVPNLVIMQPKDEPELANMLYTATRMGKPVVIRYPRGPGPGHPVPPDFSEIPIGKAEIVRSTPVVLSSPPSDVPRSVFPVPRSPVWFWVLGDMLPLAEATAERLQARGVAVGIVNARFVRPLDETLLAEHGGLASAIVTMENGVVAGGFGSGVEEFVAERRLPARVLRFGWPDRFIPQGKPQELMERFGLTPDAVAGRVLSVLASASR